MGVVAGERLLKGRRAAENDQGLDPIDRLDGGSGWRGKAAQELGLDDVVEGGQGAEVSPRDAEAGAVHVHAEAEFAVDYGGVLGEVLDMRKGGSEGSHGCEHIRKRKRPAHDGSWSRLSLEMKGGDNTERVGGAAEGVVD